MIIASGEQEGTATVDMTVAQIVLGSTVHTTLVNLIDQSILVSALNEPRYVLHRRNCFIAPIPQVGLTISFSTSSTSRKRTFTVFAPTDTAFVLDGIDDKYISAVWIQHLSDIVSYHVTSTTIKSSDLQFGPLIMLNGEVARVTSLSPPTLDNIDSTSPVAIVEPFDIEGSNGVVHSIDGVLKPTSVTNYITDIIAQDENYSVLYTMILAADLNVTLKGEG
jgi:Fasciclin domain